MRKYIVFCILIVLSYWTMKPLLREGYFSMHDDTQVARVVAMGRALQKRQFPVRWVSDLGYGYGYPIFNFYGPLPYYFGGLLYAFGANGLFATKCMIGAGILLAAFTMYSAAASKFGTAGGIVAALSYLYAPYHAVQAYVRGAIGELWAVSFLPLVLSGIIASFDPKKQKNAILIGGLGFTGIILSHTIIGYISFLYISSGFIGYWCVCLFRKHVDIHILKAHCFMLLFGLGISAFFWLPALGEMQYTSVSKVIGGSADFRNHFLCLSQLWDSSWGFAGSAPGCIDGISFKLGKIQILLSGLAVALWFFHRTYTKNARKAMISGMTLAAVSLFGMLSTSERLWVLIPNAEYIQYPWRLLTFALLGMSYISGYIILCIRSNIGKKVIGLLCIIGIITFNAKLFTPQFTNTNSPQSYETDQELRFRASKVSDEYLPPGIPIPQSPNDIIRQPVENTEQIHATIILDTGTYLSLNITGKIDQTIVIQRAFFPGWKYYVNGSEVFPVLDHSRPSFRIQKGETRIEMVFADTIVRMCANLISAVAVVSLLLYGKKAVS